MPIERMWGVGLKTAPKLRSLGLCTLGDLALAGHLAPGGCFVVEVIVPQLRQVPPGEAARVFTFDPDHVGIETFEDPVRQIAWSHHWAEVDGRVVRHSAPYRYVWPSELDLMAKLTGFSLRYRWAGWIPTSWRRNSAPPIFAARLTPGEPKR